MPFQGKRRVVEKTDRGFLKLTIFLYIICILICIVQADGTNAVPVFAHICTPPVFDDGGCTAPVFDGGGCTAPVFATGDCSATANLQKPCTAN